MVKIITDSTVCLPPEVAERYQISIVPEFINFGEESLRDGIDIDIPTLMERLRTSGEIPKTAAPPPELFAEEFERLVPHGETILCLLVSGRLSSTVDDAIIAAQKFPEADIRIVDTKLACSPLGTMVTLAAEWDQAGVHIDTIEARLTSMIERARRYFMVDDLEYVARSGRINAAKGLIGSLLQLKPLLHFKDGHIEEFLRTRTLRRAIERLIGLVAEQCPRDVSGYLSVLHAGVLKKAQTLAAELENRLGFKHVPIFDVASVVVIHGGPGALGVGFFVAEQAA